MHSVWNISYSYIESEDGDAPRLLKLGAYFDNKGMGECVLGEQHNVLVAAMADVESACRTRNP